MTAERGVDLSIVVVCFNDREVVVPCLESIREARPKLELEVIVVDNGSRDGSAQAAREAYPAARALAPGRNLGYAGGNNAGFREARGRYVLFLNPDTLIREGALERMVERADSDERCGAAGPRVVGRDGRLQRSCFRSPRVLDFAAVGLMLHRIPGYERAVGLNGYRDAMYEGPFEPDVVSGCCILARRELLERIGAFDEEYFIYFEETDLCERIRRAGYRVLYVPDAEIVHLGGATTVKQETWFRIQFEKSRRRFFLKHRGRGLTWASGAILAASLALRLALGGAAAAVTLGRWRRAREKTAMIARILGWQLGLVEQGEKPT
ncbi:MAG: glycosyltransferase family 2 protein [Planctomycetota bacterium]